MRTIPIVLIFAAAYFSTNAQSMSNLEKLVETEKAFAKTALEEGTRKAFLEFLADDGVVFQPGAVNGKQFWQSRPESPALLAWNPVWADLSSDGSIGYTTGDWDFRPKGKDDVPTAFGQYITIWKLQSEQEFKAVLDIGISHEKPETVKTEWHSPEKTLPSKATKPVVRGRFQGLKTQKFEEYFADDVRLYRNGKFPILGKKHALSEARREQLEITKSTVLSADCEGLDDLSFCFGEIERYKKDNRTEKGNLVRIWKFRNGTWRIVLDVYTKISERGSDRSVVQNTLISNKLPKIKIEVDKAFEYVGRFDFKIRDVAAGERFVFVDADGKKVKRLFIAQFEGFLPHIDDYYRYSFKSAQLFGSHKFRQNNYAYSNKESREQNPNGEGTLTYDFLVKKGYEVEDELMMSRFITVPAENKKHELILYYLENVSSSGHRLVEFYKDDSATEIWQEIGKRLKERSLKVFTVK